MIFNNCWGIKLPCSFGFSASTSSFCHSCITSSSQPSTGKWMHCNNHIACTYLKVIMLFSIAMTKKWNEMKCIPGRFSVSSSSFAHTSCKRVSALTNFAFRVMPVNIKSNQLLFLEKINNCNNERKHILVDVPFTCQQNPQRQESYVVNKETIPNLWYKCWP